MDLLPGTELCAESCELRADESWQPDVQAGRNELRTALCAAMESQPARYRQIILLYDWRGVTMREIGRAFGVNESRVSQAGVGAHGWILEIDWDHLIRLAAGMNRVNLPIEVNDDKPSSVIPESCGRPPHWKLRLRIRQKGARYRYDVESRLVQRPEVGDIVAIPQVHHRYERPAA